VGEKEKDNNILSKIRIGGAGRARNGAIESDALTGQLYHQWEILTIHKTTAQELSKIAERLVENLKVVQQDYEAMTLAAKTYYEKIQSASPHSQMSKCIKQFVEMHEQLTREHKLLHEEFSKILDPRMRYFLNTEFAIAREKKKKIRQD